MIIQNMTPFVGQHCETTTTGTLLKQIGIDCSEPMLFGLGEGLGFIFWQMKTMDFPFIGGRVKPDVLTENLCRNLDLTLTVAETTSKKKAWQNVVTPLEQGQLVGLKLDCYHLDYFTNKIHFAGHYVTIYGYDEAYAYLVDTAPQGSTVKTTLTSLALARSEKGPMSSRNRSYTIGGSGEEVDLKTAVKQAIYRNAQDYLNPPIQNIGYKGILKASQEIKKWFQKSEDVSRDLQTMAMLMERAGTGGSLFRNLYRDFLKESAELLESADLKVGYEHFAHIAPQWKRVAELFHRAGETQDSDYIDQAAQILVTLSEKERTAMEILAKAGV